MGGSKEAAMKTKTNSVEAFQWIAHPQGGAAVGARNGFTTPRLSTYAPYFGDEIIVLLRTKSRPRESPWIPAVPAAAAVAVKLFAGPLDNFIK